MNATLATACALASGGPLLRAAELEREMRELKARFDREMGALQEEHELVIETAVEARISEEAYPYGTYRLETRITAGRRSIDEDLFRELYPGRCETVLKVPTLARAEKILGAKKLAAVIKHGEPKIVRSLAFEPATLIGGDEA